MRAAGFLFCALIAVFIGSSMASAHEGRPLYIELEEKAGGAVFLKWRVPSTLEQGNAPVIQLPADCERVQAPQSAMTPAGEVGQGLFDCRALEGGLFLDIAYPYGNPSVSTLTRITRPSGEVRIVRSGPSESRIDIPAGESAGSVAREYLTLGVEHILTGYDHLLFIACLLLLAGTMRRVLLTVTGFTIAHSVTLALAAVDLVRLPVPPLEAAIALSIVFVAAELARPSRETLTWRYPMLVSSGFGLLHGFGFAAVLGEIGLPQTEVPLALLFFNLGVEVGQVAFILVLAVVLVAVTHVIARLRAESERMALGELSVPVGYVVGTLACFWTVERVVAFIA